MKRKGVFIVSMLLAALAAAAYAGAERDNRPAQPEQTGNPKIVIDSYDMQDYICIVNKSLHPNLDSYVRKMQSDFIIDGDASSVMVAAVLEGIRQGGTGSGFVYVDSQGRNYIITNYHVIVGGDRFSATFEIASKANSLQNKNAVKREKIIFRNLTVLGADESLDLAILAFPEKDKPFRKGLPIYVGPIKAGDEARAYGYPGTTGVPSWSITSNIIVNANKELSKSRGWFIQHGAALDHGNSGGPLMVRDKNSRWDNFSVAGVNSFYLEGAGSNAFFAIPGERLLSFIESSFKPLDENALKTRIDSFTKVLNDSKTELAYSKLATFLSSSMIAANPEAAIEKLSRSSIQEAIALKLVNGDMPLAISLAVANNLLVNVSNRNRNIQAEFLSLSQNDYDGYTVRFLISGYPYKSEWIREWGDWRLDSFYEDDGEVNDFDVFSTPHPVGKRVLYTLQSKVDVDWYKLDVPTSGNLTVRTEGNVATQIRIITDPSTKETIDKTTIGKASGRNAKATGNVQAGEVYVEISLSSGNPGEYALIAEIGNLVVSTPSTTTTTTTTTGRDVTVTISNNTFFTIKSGGIWFADQEHTLANLKAFNLGGDLTHGISRRITLPSIDQSRRYCILVQDEDGDYYIQHNVSITPDMTIKFTLSDIVDE